MTRPDCPLCGLDRYVSEAAVGRGFVCTGCNHHFSSPRPARKRGSYGASTRKRSNRQEGHNARDVGGRVTANSGAGRDKGDVKLPGLLREEDKTTRGRSYVLKLDDLRKVAAAAVGDEIPTMCISFEDDLSQQYVVLPRAWFQQLFNLYRESQ